MVIRQNATCRVDARDQGANSPEFVRAKITRVSIGCTIKVRKRLVKIWRRRKRNDDFWDEGESTLCAQSFSREIVRIERGSE